MGKLLFGSDPEIFVVSKDNNECVPVPHFIVNEGVPEIGYDETRKHPVILKNDKTKVIMDGVAFEFNTTPTNNSKEFYNDIQDTLNMVGEFADKFNCKVAVVPTVKYDFFKYYKQGDKLLEWCGIFGCDPDEDAIFDNYHSPEIDVTTHGYRYGGGHLHISDNNTLINKFPKPFIKLLAIYVGVYCIAKSPFIDLEKLRTFKYGQPGRFRVQNYPSGITGIEYRTPSNYWTSNEEMINGVMKQSYKAYNKLQNPAAGMAIINEFLSPAVQVIQNCDQILAKDLLNVL